VLKVTHSLIAIGSGTWLSWGNDDASGIRYACHATPDKSCRTSGICPSGSVFAFRGPAASAW
jgi:hypothetical protein